MSGLRTKGILAAIFLGLAGCETVYKAATEERPLSVLGDKAVAVARAVEGVVAVKSFIQLKAP